MSTHSESPLVAKIRKLMAKANDKSCTEAEAATFAAKVQELLVANGLAMGDIGEEKLDHGAIEDQKHADRWSSPARKHLLRAVCRYYMCELLVYPRQKIVRIVGRPSNVIVSMDMADYLIKTTVRISNDYGRTNVGSNVIDFRRGCMARLSERLDEELQRARKAAEPKYEATGNPGNLPALFQSEEKQVHTYLKEKFNVKYVKSKGLKQGTDAARGRSAADDISLNRQVGGSTGSRLQIGAKT